MPDTKITDLTVRVARLETQIEQFDRILTDFHQRSLQGRWQAVVHGYRRWWRWLKESR